MYFNRILKTQLEEAMKHFPVILLTGARQVGKSTLAREILDNYITLDDLNVYSSLQADPQSFIKSLQKPVAIDEVQKAPDILSSIKLVVDNERINGSYLLTGSANIMGYKNITDTLAGRIALLELMPLSLREISGKTDSLLDMLFNGDITKQTEPLLSKQDIIGKIIKGGYPEIQKIDSSRGRYQWFSSYIQTYIEHDVRDIGELRNIDKFIKMYRMLASRSGNLLNKTDIARNAEINFKTFDNYLELLKLVYQVNLLKSYHANIDKRLMKTEKLFFLDSGILAFLLNITTENEFISSSYKGSLFETFVFAELLKEVKYSEKHTGFYYFRTSDSQEIDFIIEQGSEIIAIEVKLSESIRKDDFRHISFLQSKVKNMTAGYVFYLGNNVLPFGKDLYAVPVSFLQ